MAASDYRAESDLLGQLNIPADAYYGIHTLRAWLQERDLGGCGSAQRRVRLLGMSFSHRTY